MLYWVGSISKKTAQWYREKALVASIDSLPSFTNLKKWGRRLFDNCPLCKGKGTLLHILNNCQNMLDRYQWRHNNWSVFLFLLSKNPNYSVIPIFRCADLENHTIWGGTIPPKVILHHGNLTLFFTGPLKSESFSLSCWCHLSQTSTRLTAPKLIDIPLLFLTLMRLVLIALLLPLK